MFLRGSSYFKKNQFELSLHDFELLLQIEQPDISNIDAIYYKGMSLSKLNQPKLAIDDFTIVLSLNPNHVNAAFARAACYNTLGQFSEAIQDYNFALVQDQTTGLKQEQRKQDRRHPSSMGSRERGYSRSMGLAEAFSPVMGGRQDREDLPPLSSSHRLWNPSSSSSQAYGGSGQDDASPDIYNGMNPNQSGVGSGAGTGAGGSKERSSEHYHALGYQYRKQGNCRVLLTLKLL